MITWSGWPDRCGEASQEAYDRAKAIDPGAWSLNGTERRRETAVIQAERELAIEDSHG